MLWEDTNTLILADLHLGKVTHFRKSGVPLPKAAELDNYDRLATILLNSSIERVLILGDLFHSILNSEWNQFKTFLSRFSNIQFILVMGNHDILSSEKYDAENLRIYSESYQEAGFLFSHHPQESDSSYNICGHVHPAVRLNGKAKQSLRLPCFYFGSNQAILPAFGTFTGLHTIEPKLGDDIFLVANDAILKVS